MAVTIGTNLSVVADWSTSKPFIKNEESSSLSFNPEFIEKTDRFDTLRYLDWMKTNDSKDKSWSDRPTVGPSYDKDGVPVEVMVDLANQTDTNPWFTIPHQATDDYVTKFAQYVKNNLEPGLKVYVEYSNEVWNGRFAQSQWVQQQGQKEWGGKASPADLRNDWYSKRTTEITQIWDRVFGADKERVIGVMAAHAANVGVAQRELSYEWADKPLSNEEYGIDAIAISPYFGYYLGLPENASQVQNWTEDQLFDELTQGGVLQGGPEGGALQQTYGWISDHVRLANQEGLPLISYEGGQHLVGVGPQENNKALTDLFIEANRDPRIGQIYQQFIQKWSDLGGGLFVHLNDIGEPSKYGSWGALENTEQDNSPKYDALTSFI
jgi:hypothetical protein